MRIIPLLKDKYKIGKDIFLNIFASFVCTGILNLVVYPLFAKYYSSEIYGAVLTAIGVVNILFSSIGNSLNNVRLITNRTSGKQNKNNPYNLTILISSVIGTIIGIALIQIVLPLSIITTVLLSLTLLVGINRAYYVVAFRLQINYVRHLISNLIVASGYLLGILLIKKVDYWPLPFLLGEALSLIYIFARSDLLQEGFLQKKDEDKIIKSFILLLACNSLANILVYLDRFFIYPILGAEYVSIFTVASFWGKCFSPFIAPIAMVVLSYLSKEGAELSLKKYEWMFAVTLLPICILCLLGLVIATPLTKMLYPSLINDAEPYIIIASIGALVGSATNLIMPMIMSVCKMKELFIIQGIQFIIYIVFAYWGSLIDGLRGFCYAVLGINLVKVAMYYFFGWYKLKKEKDHLIDGGIDK